MLEVTNKVEVEAWALDISNNSAVQPAEMAENNTDTKMGDSEGPPSQTSDDQKVLCYICEETEAVVAFKPCGHTVVCIGSSTFCFSYCSLFCVNRSNFKRA